MIKAPPSIPNCFRPASVALAGALLILSGGLARAQWPDVIEAKNIAEEGFIYGLPIVENYAAMYAFSVDRNSGQFKAPFNQIKNEARVFTYKDTSVVTPNSDTPYSTLWLDLRAEPRRCEPNRAPPGRCDVRFVRDRQGRARSQGRVRSRGVCVLTERGSYLGIRSRTSRAA
jgi:hypothetical protein